MLVSPLSLTFIWMGLCWIVPAAAQGPEKPFELSPLQQTAGRRRESVGYAAGGSTDGQTELRAAQNAVVQSADGCDQTD